MILVRSPLRITLGGGGTDLPAYAREHGGFCLTAAITQYVYVSVIRPFEPGIYLKYSEIERAITASEVKHPIIREALQMLHVPDRVEITTLADIPAGTGLGSSSSFTSALLKALAVFCDTDRLSDVEFAEQVCDLEIQHLQAPIGPQDQYATVLGGLQRFWITSDGVVACRLQPADLDGLNDRLLLYFTGYVRDASRELQSHSTDALHEIKALGYCASEALMAGDWNRFGRLLDEHWQAKKRRSQTMSNPRIDAWYDLAKQHGAIGGKLVGAGGGGCLLFLTEDPQKLRAGLKDSGLQEIRFRFDMEGAKVLVA